MGRKKLLRFSNNLTAENVVQEGKELFGVVKGNWNKLYFRNNNPIVLELACGYGEYTIGLARNNPNVNYVGIDIKGERIAVGSEIANFEKLNNVAFLRINIHFIQDFFEVGEVSEIWITFPDPFNSRSNPARRLTHPKYLGLYKQILSQSHKINLKTDNQDLYEFSLRSISDFGVKEIKATDDFYGSDLYDSKTNFKTRFEDIFTLKGFCVKFISCVLS